MLPIPSAIAGLRSVQPLDEPVHGCFRRRPDTVVVPFDPSGNQSCNRPRDWHVEPALLRAVYPPRLSCGSREAGTRSAARSEEWSSRARRSSPRPKRTLPGLTLLSDTSVACVGHSGDDVPCLVADSSAPGACHRPEGLVSQSALTRASTEGPLPTVVDPGGKPRAPPNRLTDKHTPPVAGGCITCGGCESAATSAT